ncbi:hypothetical protein A3F37_00545 [Candidatus Saccharibacteria bacterium RIFCSPHIGHO2_12_FULL_41_12]|nr:MAG: hypothetical protein A3F37_00545 [Candidatus Saccharibacteria bacterium RIFCSPHIGHO2_12_FULL_41_12]
MSKQHISDEVKIVEMPQQVAEALHAQIIETKNIALDLKNQLEKMQNDLNTVKNIVKSTSISRSAWVRLRYNKRLSEIVVSGYYIMKFESTLEGELLRYMFTKRGKPLDDRFQYSEFIKEFKIAGIEKLHSARAISKIAYNLRDRFRKELGYDQLHVDAKEFYWLNVR